jgi:hypothetical protein
LTCTGQLVVASLVVVMAIVLRHVSSLVGRFGTCVLCWRIRLVSGLLIDLL